MRIVIYRFVAKSFAYVAILAMGSVATFVVGMDIFRYCFGIDPVEEEREWMRRENVDLSLNVLSMSLCQDFHGDRDRQFQP